MSFTLTTIAIKGCASGIIYAPASKGDWTGHPVTLARWNCKAEALTQNSNFWKFMQEHQELRVSLDG